jgi:hypothetical protein
MKELYPARVIQNGMTFSGMRKILDTGCLNVIFFFR